MRINTLILCFLLLFCFNYIKAQQQSTALVGATIIDVSNYGNNTNDLNDAVIIFQNGKIKQVGSKKSIKIAAGTKVIDVTGKFIIPGLIDGFSALNNQGQANAHLYMGVTTISGGIPGDRRRGDFFIDANPSPRLKRIAAIPNDADKYGLYEKAKPSPEDISGISQELDQLDSLKAAGYSTIMVHHRFPQELMQKVVKQTEAHGMSTIGEINMASYQNAMKEGINSFVHTSKYVLGALPDSVRIPFMQSPFDSVATIRKNDFVSTFSIETNKDFVAYAKEVASSHTALMPTLSLLYSSLPDHKNLWKEPAALALSYKDIWSPLDTLTGKSSSWITTERAVREIEIEKGFAKAGAHYITGSGADAFGTMPGISEHIEITMLHNIGLTNRQALAAATNNFSIFCKWNDIGLVKEGRYADLLVLSADPLDDLKNLGKIDMVWLNGTLLNREALLKK